MPRIRSIKKMGSSHYILLSPADLLDFNLSEGDKIDIEDILIFGKKKLRSKK